MDCPNNNPIYNCDQSLILRAYCPSHPLATPVLDACGACQVHFYDDNFDLVIDCESAPTQCMSDLGDSLVSMASSNIMDLVSRVKLHLEKDGPQFHVKSAPIWPYNYERAELLALEAFPYPLHPLCYLDQLTSTGDCGITQRWYYDKSTFCQPYTYRGCDKNANHFTSRDECEKYCSLPKQKTTVLTGTYLPYCTDIGYGTKQCHNNYCWCTSASGIYIAGSLTRNELTCYTNGTFILKTPPLCADNTQPKPCQTACASSSCPGHSQASCYIDPCDPTCQSYYRDDQGVTVNCDVSENTCHQPAMKGGCGMNLTRWFYNPKSKHCEMFQYSGCGGNANMFLSYSLCQQTCDTQIVEPSILGCEPKTCLNSCIDKSCDLFLEAVCLVNPCTCEPQFYDPHSRDVVNCTQVASKCQRARATAVTSLTTVGNRDTSASVYIPECDRITHRFIPKQCSTTHCFCVNGDGDIEDDAHVEHPEGVTDLKCGLNSVVETIVNIVFDQDFDTIVTNETQFIIDVTASIEDIIKQLALELIKEIIISKGSINVQIIFEQKENVSVDASAAADAVQRKARQGEMTVTVDGKDITANPNKVTVSKIYSQSPPPTTTPVLHTTRTRVPIDGHMQTVLIAVAAGVAVLLVILIVALILICRQCRKAGSKLNSNSASDTNSSELAQSQGSLYYQGSILSPDNRIMKRTLDYFPSHEMYEDYTSIDSDE